TTGTVTGRVTDPQGLVLPGATIRLTDPVTFVVRSTVADQSGVFTLSGVTPGRHRIEVILLGFKTRDESVVVMPGVETRFNVELGLGSVIVEPPLEVTREPPLIEPYHAALGLLIPNRDLIELPLNGRNFTQLGTLMPGVFAPPAALGGQAGDATPGGFGNATGGFNVNGMRNQSNNFLLDGAPNNDTFNSGFVLRPPPDAIDEFRIFTHDFNAEYGRNAGAVGSVVTRGAPGEGGGWGGGVWAGAA